MDDCGLLFYGIGKNSDKMWATRESSAVRIGVRRAGELGYEWKGVDRVTRRVENEGLKASKARVSKRPARRAHGGRHVVEGAQFYSGDSQAGDSQTRNTPVRGTLPQDVNIKVPYPIRVFRITLLEIGQSI